MVAKKDLENALGTAQAELADIRLKLEGERPEAPLGGMGVVDTLKLANEHAAVLLPLVAAAEVSMGGKDVPVELVVCRAADLLKAANLHSLNVAEGRVPKR